MKPRYTLGVAGALWLVTGLWAGPARAQDAAVPPPPSTPIIHAEKRLVLVDAVVTDKKGNYIRDLTVKDFRVWDDKKEQSIESFSFQADPASPLANQNHYLILFFDNSTMQYADQMRARQAATQFIDANSGPKRLMAIVNFGGSLQVAQNFTDDKDRLKQVVGGVKFSSVSPNPEVASMGGPPLTRAEMDFGARDVLLALRSLAKSLGSVEGRKTLIFLSAGFPLDLETRSELTAVIDVCNKANVAIYPIDVRGLVAGRLLPPSAPRGLVGGAVLTNASYVAQQRGGSGGSTSSGGGGRTGGVSTGGGGKTGGGSTSGGTRSVGGGNTSNSVTRGLYGQQNPFNQPRSIVPILPNVSKNQEVLYALAAGTGGFVIVNTNDLLGGLQKIGSEQNEYYILGYTPAATKEGDCHDIKVKVERGGTNVRARTGYCDTKPQDLLAGSAAEKNLEARALAAAGGNVGASLQAPYFYTAPNTARVDVAMEIPPNGLQFTKEKGKLHSEMNVLGIATESDGTVAARFSDTVKFEFENKKELEEFQQKPVHYETQFEIGSGKYDLRVAFASAGTGFGKVQAPLVIDPYDEKKFALSGVVLSKTIHRVGDLDVGLDAELLEDRKPLVTQGMQIVPAASYVFSKSESAAAYLEVYEPLLLKDKPPRVGVQMRLIDRKTGQTKLDSGFINFLNNGQAGNPVIPVGMKLPIEKLDAGIYRAEFKAMDEAGNVSVVRAAEFQVQ